MQVPQAQQLIAMLGEPLPTVVVGNLNSEADGSTTPTYGMMQDAGFADVWPPQGNGDTGCHASDLLSLPSHFDQRIDFILLRGDFGFGPGDIAGSTQSWLTGVRTPACGLPTTPASSQACASTVAGKELTMLFHAPARGGRLHGDRHVRPWLILAITALATSACASHRYSVREPVEMKFGAFDTVEVLPFTSTVDTEAARQVADKLPDALVADLAKATRKGSKEKMFSVVTDSVGLTEGVLTISGRVLSFEEGSRAQRYFIGLGAGKASATVECVFMDKASGRQVAVATFDGELSGGLFGGSSGADRDWNSASCLFSP